MTDKRERIAQWWAKQKYQVMDALTPDEEAKLREPIRKHVVLQFILKDKDGNIIDGHHRKRIADELGVPCPCDVLMREGITDTEKRVMALTLNVDRRMLTRAQKRKLLAKSIAMEPELSNREHAKRTGTSPTTAGKVREEVESNVQVGHNTERTEASGRAARGRKPGAAERALGKPKPSPKAPPTAKRREEVIRRQIRKKLEAEIEPRVRAEIKSRLGPVSELTRKTYSESRRVLDGRKGILTRGDFDLIRSCLRPDSRLSASDEKLGNAFRIFNEAEILFLNETDCPTTRTTLPSLEELLTRRKGAS